MTRPFIDVVVTTPGSQHGPKSLRVPGHVANLLSIEKTRDYERHFDFTPSSMVRFYPFSVEVFGSLGTEAVKVIHWLASLAYPLQEVDGEPRDVDGRRSFYITRMFARLSAALAEAQSERIAAWIDRLLRKRGELVMLAPEGGALAAVPEDAEENNDVEEAVEEGAAVALDEGRMDVMENERDGERAMDLDDMELDLGERLERGSGPRALGARGGSDLNIHYLSRSEGT